MKYFKFGDLFIFIFVAAGIFFSFRLFVQKKADSVLIEAAGKQYRYTTDSDQVINVTGELGVTTVEIKDRKVRILDSACKNKTCVNQGYGTTLICLPNKVIVTVDGGEQFDAVAQ